jgi:four helix bundle protein
VVENEARMPESVEKLEIWQEAVEIVRILYELTKSWPREEMYGLTSQIRRAAVSIPANIAEGVGRGGPGDMSRFAQIALGSLYELDTLLYLGVELKYASQTEVTRVRDRLTLLAKRTSSFIRYQEGNR